MLAILLVLRSYPVLLDLMLSKEQVHAHLVPLAIVALTRRLMLSYPAPREHTLQPINRIVPTVLRLIRVRSKHPRILFLAVVVPFLSGNSRLVLFVRQALRVVLPPLRR
jgi:hypothetical protein